MGSSRYDKKKLLQQALDQIDKYKLFNVVDVTRALGMPKSTFYKYFPEGSDQLRKVQDALQAKRVEWKMQAANNLMKNTESPAAQIAILKLMAEPDERAALSTRDFVVEKNNDEANLAKLSTEELKLWKKLTEKMQGNK